MSTDLKRRDETIPSVEVDEKSSLQALLAEANLAFDRQRITLRACEPISEREASDALDVYFLAWREATLRRDYLNKTHGDMRIPTVCGMQAYVADAGQPYDYHGLPSREHFRQHISPTVLALANGDVSSLIHIGLDALNTLECLMASELSCLNFRTSPRLLIDFFSNEPPESEGFFGGGKGQFKHYYSKYGASFTRAVAIHQGWESDRHYDGGDYTNSRYEIDRRFLPYYEKLPEIYRDQIFDMFVSYGGRHRSWRFLEMATNEIGIFLERDKTHLLTYYVALLEGRPKIYDAPAQQSELLLPVDELILELEALDQMGNGRNVALHHAKITVALTGGLGAYQGLSYRIASKDKPSYPPYISFRDPKQAEEPTDKVYRPKALILDLQNAGHTEDQMADILALPERHPWLKMGAFEILKAYLNLEGNFPGGVPGLIRYLEQIKQSERCLDHFIAAACEGSLPPPEYLERYCQLGVELVSRLGDGASDYFFLIKGCSVFRIMDASANPDDFERHIRAALELACSLQPTVKSEDQVQKNIFGASLEGFDKPDFIDGLKLIIEGANSNNGNNDRVNDSVQFGGGLSQNPFVLAIMYYGQLGLAMPGKEVNKTIDYQQVARILCYLARRGLASDQACWHFIRQIEEGLMPRTALVSTLAEEGLFDVESEDLLAMDITIGPGTLRQLLSSIAAARQCVAQRLDLNRFDLPGDETLVAVGEQLEALKTHETALKALSPDAQREGIDLTPVIDSVRSALQFMALKAILTTSQAPNFPQKPELVGRDLLATTNPNTSMTILTMAALVAAGVLRIPGISEQLAPLPFDFRAGMPPRRLGTLLSDRKWADQLRVNAERALPLIEALVIDARTQMPGLMPVGGKIHTTKPMDGNIFQAILDFFGLGNTPFRLIHANDSLLLPAAVSALELQWLILILQQFGVIDSNKPEIQVAVGDRLSPELAAMVGSATLLATQRGVIYEPTAFSTTHDGLTGKRLMAYDAGVRQKDLPFDLVGATGRTDILGRRHYGDIDNYRILGTLAAHFQRGSHFAPIADRFFSQYKQILAARGLSSRLRESAWVYDHRTSGDSDGTHYTMVNAFGRAWMRDSQMPNLGVIGQVHRLIAEAVAQIQAQKGGLITMEPDDYQRLLNY